MRKVVILILSFFLVISLSSCGVEDRRYTYANYMGMYEEELYFMLSDKTEKNLRHLYKFENEEFVLVETFNGVHFNIFEEGLLLGISYELEDVKIYEYDIETGEISSFSIAEEYSYGRIVSYHNDEIMFYSPGYPVEDDETVIIYSTVTSEVVTKIEDSRLDVGYGEGDFDENYIYLAEERGPGNYAKSMRIDRTTGDIEILNSGINGIPFLDDKLHFYSDVQMGKSHLQLIDSDIYPTELITMYGVYSNRLHYDEISDTFLYSDYGGSTVKVLQDNEFVSYDVDYNGYSFGFIDASTYYTLEIIEYGSIFKREVVNIQIKSITTNEVLYQSGNVTIANQIKWDEEIY